MSKSAARSPAGPTDMRLLPSLLMGLVAAGFAWLFRRFLFTGFDGIIGDDSDGEILIGGRKPLAASDLVE